MKSIFSVRFAFCVFKINLISFSVCLSPHLLFPSLSLTLPVSLSLSVSLPLSICFFAVHLLLLLLFSCCCLSCFACLFELLLCCSLIRLAVCRRRCRVVYIEFLLLRAFCVPKCLINMRPNISVSPNPSNSGRQAGRQAGRQLTYREHDLGWFSSLASLASLACHCVQLCKNCFYMRRKNGSADFKVVRGEQCNACKKYAALPLEQGKIHSASTRT